MCYICFRGGDDGDTAFLHDGVGSDKALFLTGWDASNFAVGKDSDIPQSVGDDIADNTSSTTVLNIGGSISTNLNANVDKDFFQVNLVAGQTYVFTMTRAGSAPALDTFLEIRTAGGALLKENDDGGIGTNSVLMYRATETGTHFLSAGSWNSASSGAYTVTAQAIETGPSTVTTFASNGKPQFSWTEAAYQITREGASWSADFGQSAVVTYSFRADAPATMPSDTTGFSRFNATQIAAAEAALQAWAQVANITFVRVGTGTTGDAAYSNDATIVFGNYSGGQAGASAFAYLPTAGNTATASVQGDVWVNNSIATNANPVSGEVGFHVLMHEIGHALGLSHPGDYDAEEGVSITYAANAEYQNDSRLFTVMSYFATTSVGGAWPVYPGSPQLHDIAAIQRLYGANASTRSGDTVYGFNSNTGRPEFTITSPSQAIGFTVWDGGGNDTLDFSGFTQNANIDLREESFMNVGPGNPIYNVVIARGSVIENAIGGSGNDLIYGNAVVNVLNGGGGNDTLWGGGGNDTLRGESGDDTLRGGDGADLVYGGAGHDRFEGDSGNDYFDGGDGYDEAAYEGSWTNDVVYRFGSVIAVVSEITGIDRLVNTESVRWTDRIFSELDQISEFRALDYIAGYADLIGALGLNGQAGFDHYLAAGFREGRAVDGFDAFQYTASYDDLIAAWGSNEDAAVRHFLLAGFIEGRSRDAFDGLSYVAGYTDLLATFAGDESAAARHFVEVGYEQGRSRDAFDELRYIAGYDDLIQAIGINRQAATFHWVYGGFGEGRSATLFDPMQYIASHSDLILAFGADAAAGAIHFIVGGFREGRSRDGFDGLSYVASHVDLLIAIGANESSAARHYITSGFAEGRQIDTFDELRYIAGYDDLIASIGSDRAAATAHWVNTGYAAGRSATAFDPAQYIASYPDLIAAFGTNTEAGTIHFLQYGFGEARARDTFDAAQYLANYADLRAAFGTDEHLATLHYIQGGFAEGRTDEAPISSASGAAFIVADTYKRSDLAPEVLPDLERTEPVDDASYGWAELFGQRVRTVSADVLAATVMAAGPELTILSATMTTELLVGGFGGDATASAPPIASEPGQWIEAIADVSDLNQLPDAAYADLAADALMPPDVTFEWRLTTDGQLEWSVLQG